MFFLGYIARYAEKYKILEKSHIVRGFFTFYLRKSNNKG